MEHGVSIVGISEFLFPFPGCFMRIETLLPLQIALFLSSSIPLGMAILTPKFSAVTTRVFAGTAALNTLNSRLKNTHIQHNDQFPPFTEGEEGADTDSEIARSIEEEIKRTITSSQNMLCAIYNMDFSITSFVELEDTMKVAEFI